MTCDDCHDTGFVLNGMDVTHCLCETGKHLREAHMAGKAKPKAKFKDKRREWTPYSEEG